MSAAKKRAVTKKAPAKKAPAKKAVAKKTPTKSPPAVVASVRAATPEETAHETPLGAHISTAGGVTLAPARAVEIGATAMQIFTKVANQWKEKEISEDDANAFQAELAKTSVRFTNAHDSYLINLASPDPALRAKSLASFTAELTRCNTLKLNALCSHPGNFMDERASGIARNADAITEALEAAPGPTRLLMELTAGQGTVIGSSFEEMADLISRIPAKQRKRVGVCLDTAHIFAAGYDLIGDYDGVWSRFADTIGYERLGLLHLNDSAAPLGAKKDRHALIGEGFIGDGPFQRIMQDPRLAGVPKVLETPKGDDMVTNDRAMLKKLRAFVRA